MKKAEKAVTVSSSSEWKKAKQTTIMLELPSGNIVEVKKRLGIFECSSAGHIPLELFSTVFEFGNKLVDKSMSGIGQEEVVKTLDVLRRVACLVVVNPKVVLSQEEDSTATIVASDIPEEDLFAIFGSVLQSGGGKELRPFPAKQQPGISG